MQGGDISCSSHEQQDESNVYSGRVVNEGRGLNLRGLDSSYGSSRLYRPGQNIGCEVKWCPKIQNDPIMELKHIIGYTPDTCSSLKWSAVEGENTLMFASNGTLIAMDIYTNQQKRFFFGHNAPICCFDVSKFGGLIASAQSGPNPEIRIWDYHTARILAKVTEPVNHTKQLHFSEDGRFLASVDVDSKGKEMIIIWYVSLVRKEEKLVIAAK
jgi:WD40 repeat protein